MAGRTTLFAAFANDGTPAINVWDFNRRRLETLVSDRRSNGDALPGEHVQHCTIAFYRRTLAARGLPVPTTLYVSGCPECGREGE
jgi:hypothetical protein